MLNIGVWWWVLDLVWGLYVFIVFLLFGKIEIDIDLYVVLNIIIWKDMVLIDFFCRILIIY